MSNYPDGAEYDPNAPYNQPTLWDRSYSVTIECYDEDLSITGTEVLDVTIEFLSHYPDVVLDNDEITELLREQINNMKKNTDYDIVSYQQL